MKFFSTCPSGSLIPPLKARKATGPDKVAALFLRRVHIHHRVRERRVQQKQLERLKEKEVW